jgi:hypothetical protein
MSFTPSKTHLRRLREIYRSAGWPCLDNIEIDLLAHGLIARRAPDVHGVETLRVTDAGIEALSASQRQNRNAMSKHESLVAAVVRAMQREGRIVWTRLSARAAAGAADEKTTWRMAMPDVFSIRNTTKSAMLEPIVHEVKVSRADLLSDLRNVQKREAYLALSSQAFYVLSPKVGSAEDIPEPFGVLIADGETLTCTRFAPKRACELAFGTWMALAKSTPMSGVDDDSQSLL